MLDSGAPSGGLSKLTGSSSSVDSCEGRRAGLRGLRGLQVVVGDSGSGCSFTSVLLGEGSRAVGDRARLACGGGKGRSSDLDTLISLVRCVLIKLGRRTDIRT